jgi:CheY-like chemotaxis protein
MTSSRGTAASRACSPESPGQSGAESGGREAERSRSGQERADEKPSILLVEDNAGDVLLLRESMNENGLLCDLVVIDDGQEAIDYIDEVEQAGEGRPAIVILDLNVPKRSGREILARLRSAPFWAATPVVILSSSEAPDDRQYAAIMGASLYLRKPLDLDEFLAIGGAIRRMLERQKGTAF